MVERLSYDEIKIRYAQEWVLIGDPETDEYLETVSGEVLFHSPDRDELGRRMSRLSSRSALTAVEFLGEIPDGLEFILNLDIRGGGLRFLT